MTGLVLHIVRKDARQHRGFLGLWVVLIVVRALTIGVGLDTWLPLPLRAPDSAIATVHPLAVAYVVLSVLHVAILVALTVLIVQADLLVGTTAFWLTRPIPRTTLAAAKLISLALWLIAVPVLFDVLVLTGNGFKGTAVLLAIAAGLIERTAVVLPVAALAAITADIAMFSVIAVSVGGGCVMAQFFISTVFRLSSAERFAGSVTSARAVGLALALIACLAALLVQIRTCRPRRTWPILVTGALLLLVVANRWTLDLSPGPRQLEPGWFDTNTVRPTMRVPTAAPNSGSTSVRLNVGSQTPRPDVELVPLGIEGSLVAGNRPPEPWSRRIGMSAFESRLPAAQRSRAAEISAALGGGFASLNVVDAGTPDIETDVLLPTDRLSGLGESGVSPRFEGNVRIGALGYLIGASLSLAPGATVDAGGHRISILSSLCEAGVGCDVVVRDRAAAMLTDIRPASEVQFLVVNRQRRQYLVVTGRRQVEFGSGSFALIAEHLAVTHRLLRFEPNDAFRESVSDAWLRGAEFAVMVTRDLGAFTRPVVSEPLR